MSGSGGDETTRLVEQKVSDGSDTYGSNWREDSVPMATPGRRALPRDFSVETWKIIEEKLTAREIYRRENDKYPKCHFIGTFITAVAMLPQSILGGSFPFTILEDLDVSSIMMLGAGIPLWMLFLVATYYVRFKLLSQYATIGFEDLGRKYYKTYDFITDKDYRNKVIQATSTADVIYFCFSFTIALWATFSIASIFSGLNAQSLLHTAKQAYRVGQYYKGNSFGTFMTGVGDVVGHDATVSIFVIAISLMNFQSFMAISFMAYERFFKIVKFFYELDCMYGDPTKKQAVEKRKARIRFIKMLLTELINKGEYDQVGVLIKAIFPGDMLPSHSEQPGGAQREVVVEKIEEFAQYDFESYMRILETRNKFISILDNLIFLNDIDNETITNSSTWERYGKNREIYDYNALCRNIKIFIIWLLSCIGLYYFKYLSNVVEKKFLPKISGISQDQVSQLSQAILITAGIAMSFFFYQVNIVNDTKDFFNRQDKKELELNFLNRAVGYGLGGFFAALASSPFVHAEYLYFKDELPSGIWPAGNMKLIILHAILLITAFIGPFLMDFIGAINYDKKGMREKIKEKYESQMKSKNAVASDEDAVASDEDAVVSDEDGVVSHVVSVSDDDVSDDESGRPVLSVKEATIEQKQGALALIGFFKKVEGNADLTLTAKNEFLRSNSISTSVYKFVAAHAA